MSGPIINVCFPNAVKVECVSHTFTQCGEAAFTVCVVLIPIWIASIGAVSRSINNQSSFRSIVGEAHPRYSKTHWFGERDAIVLKFLKKFDDVVLWVRNCFHDPTDNNVANDNSQLNTLRLLIDEEAYYDEHSKVEVRIRIFEAKFEMTVLGCVTQLFQLPCYNLEGNYSCAYFVYDEVMKVKTLIELHKEDISFTC